MAERKTFTSVLQLARDAWELFKKTWISYLKLMLLATAYVFLVGLIGVLIILPISFIAVDSHVHLFSQLTPFTIAAVILLIVWLIAFVVSLIAIGIILPIAGVFILQGKKLTPILDFIKQTRKFFWPYFITILLDGFFILGGMILLVIPGFLIAFFFSFVSYEVVVYSKKGLTALKNSYFIVKSNFWEVFGRIIVLVIIANSISLLLHRLSTGNNLLGFGYFVFTLFLSWYARAYTFSLYKQVRAKATIPTEISINWIWVLSLIGWVVVIVLFVSIVSGIIHFPSRPVQMHRISPTAA